MPQPLKDIAGQKFGRLTAIRPAGTDAGGNRFWHCECECGETKEARGSELRRGAIRSCGCLYVETRRTAALKDGTSSHPLYSTWANIRTRTSNPENRQWPDYGGRGIRLHESWQDAATFLAWVDAELGSRPEGATLDRIDNDGHYEPGNLKWSTRKQQVDNQRPKVRNSEVRELLELLYDLAWR